MKLLNVKSLWTAAVTMLAVATAQAEAPSALPTIDPALPVYQRVEGLQGQITLIGSTTLAQMVSVWGQGFRQLYPEVQVQVVIEGSNNAVPSVMSGKSQIGMLSRQITPEEVKAFQDKFNYLPTVLTPAYEQIGIYVHKDNPLTSLTAQQLDAIYSTSLKRGAGKQITTWGDLGLAGQWANTPIVVHGRSPGTGSQVFFQNGVMGGGEFRKDMIPDATNLDLVQGIANDPRAIGFTGSIHEIPGIKAVPLSLVAGSKAIGVDEPGYPLVRPLQIVLNNSPSQPLPAVQVEFVKFIFSKTGQQEVAISGFAPVTGTATQISLQAIGVSPLN